MITLEQIRQLESKITRAIELIRALKEENGTLRRGLESAQRRMKELETLVEGFKTDQREIESVIVRTLHNLDDLEETTASAKKTEHGGAAANAPSSALARAAGPSVDVDPAPGSSVSPVAQGLTHASPTGRAAAAENPPAKEELDIF